MKEDIYSNFVINITDSFYALILITIIGLTTHIITRKYNNSERKRKQLRNRILYVCFLIYLFLLARIWVEGFTQILAVLGFVSAALVITNKESIMNLVGWLIINWRELFTEGDLVQLDKNKGYIKSIGLLYITMEETIEQSGYLKTGRILKIPNNHVILHPTVNFTYGSNPILQKHVLQFKPISNINMIEEVLSTVITEVNNQKITNNNSPINLQPAKHKKVNNQPFHISLSLKQEKDLVLEATVYFYCDIEDYEKVKISFIFKILEKINSSEQIFLT